MKYYQSSFKKVLQVSTMSGPVRSGSGSEEEPLDLAAARAGRADFSLPKVPLTFLNQIAPIILIRSLAIPSKSHDLLIFQDMTVK